MIVGLLTLPHFSTHCSFSLLLYLYPPSPFYLPSTLFSSTQLFHSTLPLNSSIICSCPIFLTPLSHLSSPSLSLNLFLPLSHSICSSSLSLNLFLLSLTQSVPPLAVQYAQKYPLLRSQGLPRDSPSTPQIQNC